jgi:heterodisulfide reductase subunit D
MDKLTELKKHTEIIQYCGKCGDCGTSGTQITTAKRHVDKPCMVKNVLGFEAYDARGRILILKSLLNNEIPIDESIINWAYTCTECGSCAETCLAIEGGIDTPLLMDAFRQDLVNCGHKLGKHQNVLKSVLEKQNPYNEPRHLRHEFLNGEVNYSDADYILYLGCTSSYRQRNIALAAIDLLNELEVDFTIMKDEPCCGSIIKRYGYKKEFEELAKENLQLIKERGIKKIIFPCAGCYRTYKVDYEEFNADNSLEFYHLTEFLEEYLKENQEGFKLQSHKKIAYHDPCHLGRHSGVYEAPRVLLKQIQNATFIELDALRNYSHCCGAGGGIKSSNPDLAVEVGKNRNLEAIEKSIDILVSACPFCEKNLNDGIPELANGYKVLDISEIMKEAFQKELSSEVISDFNAKSEVVKEYMTFLGKYPEIFADLISDSDMDFAIYDSFEGFEKENPMDVFHVIRKDEGIEIQYGKADDADLELALSKEAVERLIKTGNKEDYAELFGQFYNEPDIEEGWIDFLLHKRTKTLIDQGYGKFAEAAGILEDEDDAI